MDYVDPLIFQTKCGASNVIDASDGLLKCVAYKTGTTVDKEPVPAITTDVVRHVKNVYRLLPDIDPRLAVALNESFYFTPFQKSDNVIIRTTTAGTLYQEIRAAPVFYDTSHVEVLQMFPNHAAYQQSTFVGNWFDVVKGTGLFVKTNVTCMAYNSVHLLKCLNIPSDKIVLYGSTAFTQQLKTSTIESVLDACSRPKDYVAQKWNYLNFESKPMRYIVWMAGQKGYRTIQLSDEWDGKHVRHVFIDILNPCLTKLTRRNPYALIDNPKTMHWLFNKYRSENVNVEYIVGGRGRDVVYESLFQNECRLAGGSTAIYTNLAQCKKIIRYGMTPQLLMTEKPVDYSSFPKANDVERLRSYFTIVYGVEHAQVWADQTEQQLRDRWDCCEVRYLDVCKALNLTLPFAVKRQRQQVYHQGIGPQSSIEPNPLIEFKRIIQRCAEKLQYVEVFRQGKWASSVEDNVNFAGTYYFPCRGSGYYLPMGSNWYVHRRKNDFFLDVGLPTMTEPSWEQDKPLASALLAHGVDVMLVTHFMDYSTEVIDSCDVITSLSKLIKTHPFDPLVNRVIEEPTFSFPYATNSRTIKDAYVLQKQFDALVDICPNY